MENKYSSHASVLNASSKMAQMSEKVEINVYLYTEEYQGYHPDRFLSEWITARGISTGPLVTIPFYAIVLIIPAFLLYHVPEL